MPVHDDDDVLWTYRDLHDLKIVGSRTQLFRLQRDKDFPRPLKYGPTPNAPAKFRRRLVRAWLAVQAARQTEAAE